MQSVSEASAAARVSVFEHSATAKDSYSDQRGQWNADSRTTG